LFGDIDENHYRSEMVERLKSKRHGSGRRDSWSSDAELAGAAARGDPNAVRDIAERLFDRVRTSVMILAGNDRDADDLAQESLVEILRSTRTFRGRSSLETWADRITIRTSLTQLRRRNRGGVVLAECTEVADSDPKADPGKDLLHKRLSERLLYQLTRLPLKQRTAVMLRLVYDYGIAEIAGVTESSVFTVKGRLRLGLRRLRKAARHDPELQDWKRGHGG
jgi:RNA polymerase sigma-70 factor (ECF subfamily)